MNPPKYTHVVARIRAQIEDGMLKPGEPTPSGAALARATGYNPLTCRKALRVLIRDGVLVPGATAGARPRVRPHDAEPGEQDRATAARALAACLASRRRAAGLTQPELAAVTGMSVTTIGHAETGRLWQSRRFWELADKGLSADGELLALHDAYRAAAVPGASPARPARSKPQAGAGTLPTVAVTLPLPVAAVAITWADGTVTTVCPPGSPARPAGATLAR